MRTLAKFLAAVVLLTAATAIAQEQETQYGGDTIVIVVDASGSMDSRISGTSVMKMDAAKEAIWKAVKDLLPNTRIGLLVFSSGNNSTDWVYPIGVLNPERFRQAVFSPTPGGGTPLGTYIKHGANALLVERQKQLNYGTYRLIVVTDGEADWGSESSSMKRYAEEIPTRGLRLDVIGVNLAEDHALKQFAHSYVGANDVATLEQAVKKVIVESVASSSSGVGLDDSLLEAFGDGAMVKELMNGVSQVANHPLGEEPPADSFAAQNGGGFVPQAQADEGMGAGGIFLIVMLCVMGVIAIMALLAWLSSDRYY